MFCVLLFYYSQFYISLIIRETANIEVLMSYIFLYHYTKLRNQLIVDIKLGIRNILPLVIPSGN